jgi:TonB family protein
MLQRAFPKAELIGVLALILGVYQTSLRAWEPRDIPGLRYPRAAQLARLEGIVVVECTIDRDGTVKSALVQSGHPVLGEAAAKAAKGWRFTRSGEGHDQPTMRLTFEFRLVGSCKTQCCKEEFLLRYPDHMFVTSEMPSVQLSGSSRATLRRHR